MVSISEKRKKEEDKTKPADKAKAEKEQKEKKGTDKDHKKGAEKTQKGKGKDNKKAGAAPAKGTAVASKVVKSGKKETPQKKGEAAKGAKPGTDTAATPKEGEEKDKKKSRRVAYKHAHRKKGRKIDGPIDEQFNAGRLYACISSRPGQCGRCDGYILEGEELNFYLKKLAAKRKVKSAA